jgi:hypothetical protein
VNAFVEMQSAEKIISLATGRIEHQILKLLRFLNSLPL